MSPITVLHSVCRSALQYLACLPIVVAWADGAGTTNGEEGQSLPVRIECAEDAVTFRLRTKLVITYRGGHGILPSGAPEEYRRAGYLHPLVTPGGVVVSGDYPTNHRHHHGVWTSWTKTEFEGRAPDFWNMGQKKGRVDMIQWLGSRATAEGAEVEVLHRYVDLTAKEPVTVLHEGWRVGVNATRPGQPHQIDLTVRQTNVTDHPLVLPQYRYGGLGFRGLDVWDGAENCRFLTSEGTTNRIEGNESRARWCWIGGSVGGVVAGVALLGHPTNLRHPEPMRLHPTDPFFCWAPQQLGEFVIPPKGTHVLRYRILVMDGLPDPGRIEAHWKTWTRVP